MFNPGIHACLVELGFVHTAHEADIEDVGDAESGPMLSGHPGWDEYVTEDYRVIIDHRGNYAMSEYRDLAFEAWCDKMAESPANCSW